LPVGVAGEAVAAGGFESGVASELGDEDDVVAGADEAGQASVAQGVGGGLDVGLPAEAAEGEVDRPGGQPLSFQGRNSAGPSS